MDIAYYRYGSSLQEMARHDVLLCPECGQGYEKPKAVIKHASLCKLRRKSLWVRIAQNFKRRIPFLRGI